MWIDILKTALMFGFVAHVAIYLGMVSAAFRR